MRLFTLTVAPSQQLAGWIASALAPLLQPMLKKELDAMSATIQEAVSNLEAVAQRAVAEVQTLQAQHQADQATIADLTSKLAAAQAGDPADLSAIDAVTASLNAVSPAPAAPETDPVAAQPLEAAGQPQG